MCIRDRDEYVLEAGYRDTDAAAAATEELLKLPCPPTCILYPDDFSCLGGMNMLREKAVSYTHLDVYKRQG